ncbi:putative CDK4/6 [Pseudovirgaria hyperparasitica]|uniref:non-specific serine/threonine protein kinase n=1 Tax=Pseudovirgaria hyperparasitica TaxID=470096 RepID=A0A6A6WEQ6_9PEZI|nr:putative CDK4/6 [Pseudovirgaria hyperparasitica]KAF2760067.1 putative CDK4/6 [Pseudovirgaria hyperparasitica]
MASILRSARNFLRSPAPPWNFPTTGFPILDNGLVVEEERESLYSPTTFYPAKISEVLNTRYQIVGKLGYGGYSTVWLCRDFADHDYVVLKLCRSDAPNIKREIDIYRRLDSVRAKHAGATLVRRMLDNFELRKHGHHFLCIIHKPLGMSLGKLRSRVSGMKLPENILKLTLIHILIGLEFLHTHAKIIHCDLQEKNILLGIENKSILDEFAKHELEYPTPRKIDGARVVYESRDLDNTTNPGRPVLTDFGEARLMEDSHTGLIQPTQYRAPEVLLGLPWDHKVDIWNVGAMIWDLFEGRNMFNARNPKGEVSIEHQLAHIVALLGPPPVDLIRKADIAPKYFNLDGSWKGTVKIPEDSLEESERNLEGENKALFLAFLRKMMKWRPDERSRAQELLADTWLRDGDQFADQ